MTTVGDRIRIIRGSKRMKANELAKLIGISNSAISNLESGKTKANLDLLKKIARVLDVPVAILASDAKEEDVIQSTGRVYSNIKNSNIDCPGCAESEEMILLIKDAIETKNLLITEYRERIKRLEKLVHDLGG